MLRRSASSTHQQQIIQPNKKKRLSRSTSIHTLRKILQQEEPKHHSEDIETLHIPPIRFNQAQSNNKEKAPLTFRNLYKTKKNEAEESVNGLNN